MSKRQIPDTVVNNEVRIYLAELATHIETLEQHHEQLCDLAKNVELSDEQKAQMKKILTAWSNLDSQWKQLTPTISAAIMTGRFVITNK